MKILQLAAFISLCGLGSAAPSMPENQVSNVQITRDIDYLSDSRTEKLDLYRPLRATTSSGAPAIVWIHGGGWVKGDKQESRAKNICGELARAGYVCASINYKLGANVWPQNLFDCKNAVRFLRTHAVEYGIDPKRIAVAGGSAGAHLALLVGLTVGSAELEPRSPYPDVSNRVSCMIDFYGATDFATRGKLIADGSSLLNEAERNALSAFNSPSLTSDILRSASPINHVSRVSPPVFIAHGLADKTVDPQQSLELDAALTKQRVAHEIYLLPNVGHSFDLALGEKETPPGALRDALLHFLQLHL